MARINPGFVPYAKLQRHLPRATPPAERAQLAQELKQRLSREAPGRNPAKRRGGTQLDLFRPPAEQFRSDLFGGQHLVPLPAGKRTPAGAPKAKPVDRRQGSLAFERGLFDNPQRNPSTTTVDRALARVDRLAKAGKQHTKEYQAAERRMHALLVTAPEESGATKPLFFTEHGRVVPFERHLEAAGRYDDRTYARIRERERHDEEMASLRSSQRQSLLTREAKRQQSARRAKARRAAKRAESGKAALLAKAVSGQVLIERKRRGGGNVAAQMWFARRYGDQGHR